MFYSPLSLSYRILLLEFQLNILKNNKIIPHKIAVWFDCLFVSDDSVVINYV